MLIPADRFRKLLTIIFGTAFIFLALEVRFHGTYVQVLDSLSSFAVQNSLATRLQGPLTVLSWLSPIWVVAVLSFFFYGFLLLAHYRVAANWFLINQVVGTGVALILSVIIKLDYAGGFVLTGFMPDLDLLAWLYFLLNIVAIVFTRLFTNHFIRFVAVGLVAVFWLGLLLAQMAYQDMPLSSALGALTFGYAWWQWQERLYRRLGKHWQQLFNIDGRL